MRRKTLYLLIGIGLLIVASLVFAQAGDISVPWHRIAGGGGTSRDGAQFALSGTIGQPEAGVLMEGSTFKLSGGYWGGAAAEATTTELYLPMLLQAE